MWLPLIVVDLPRLQEVSFDARALAFIGAVTAGAAVLSGAPWAWIQKKWSPGATSGAGRVTDHAATHRIRDAMVVAQVATAVVLLLGSGLLIRSVWQLRSINPGFDTTGVLVAPVFLDNQQYKTGDHT